MRQLIQLPSEFDYNLLLHVLRDYKKPRDKIRGLLRNEDIIRVKKGLYVLGKEYKKPYNKFILGQSDLWTLLHNGSDCFSVLEYDSGTCCVDYQHDCQKKKTV
jgi:hypothetical protein